MRPSLRLWSPKTSGRRSPRACAHDEGCGRKVSRLPVDEPDQARRLFGPARGRSRLFGHDAARAEFEEALKGGRLHHAWLIVGPEGIGKATLAYHLAREVLAFGDEEPGGRIPAVGAEHPVFRRIAAQAHPEPAPAAPLLERAHQTLFAMDRRRRGPPPALLPRPQRRRGELARGHRRSRRRSQPECRQRSPEGSGRAAAAHGVLLGCRRRGSDPGHHSLALPHIARQGSR